MDSLAAGCPIVTADVGDRRQWLGEEFGDWLVEPGSASALADGLRRFLQDIAFAYLKSDYQVAEALPGFSRRINSEL